MFKKYSSWIHVLGIGVIVVTFYLFVMRYHTSGGSFYTVPLWKIYQIQVWIVITIVTLVIMALVSLIAYFTRNKKWP